MQFGATFKYLSNNLKLRIFPLLDRVENQVGTYMQHSRYFRGSTDWLGWTFVYTAIELFNSNGRHTLIEIHILWGRYTKVKHETYARFDIRPNGMLTILKYLTKSREEKCHDKSTSTEECPGIVSQILRLYYTHRMKRYMFRCPGWLTESTPLCISTSNHHQLDNFMPLAICADRTSQMDVSRAIFQLHSTPHPVLLAILYSTMPWVRVCALPSEHQRICSGQWCRMSHKCKTNAHGDNEYFC